MNLFQESQSETFVLEIERIVFQNPENGWTVARVTLEDNGQSATAVGRLYGVTAGERLRVSGSWIRDRKYGRQLRIDSSVALSPASLRGLERYLGSGLLPGVGKVTARRLVAHFGEETLEILDGSSDRLREVPGIGPAKARAISEAWTAQRQERDAMIFLQGHEISPKLAARVIKRFGADAAAIVKNNPYRLAEEVTGIGFTAADRVAASLGWTADAPERLGGGVLFALRHAASANGHMFLPSSDLLELAADLLDVDSESVARVLPHLEERGAVVREGQDGQRQHIYLAELHASEVSIAVNIERLLNHASRSATIDIDRALAWFEERSHLELAPGQRSAIACALREKLSILTGGPGTGKTTLVKAVVEILERKGLEILLAAPTGRAANRLSEATGREVRTIHRLLEFDPHALRFRRNVNRLLETDLLILDESSMIDAALAQAVLEALPDPARLLLVGDADQLPSVGPGRVLSDVIASSRVPVARLEEIFRQKEADGIVRNAHRIHRGQRPRADSDERGNFFIVHRSQPEEILQLVLDFASRRVPRRFGLDARREIQVISPMRRGTLGTEVLNQELAALLNPGPRETGAVGRWRIGDRVMQTRNNYDLDVFNGDIGFIVAVDSADRQLTVEFDSRQVVFQGTDLDDLTLAYACTVHKSQGSEYPCVILPLHTQHFVMLQRNLLYTGVTRATHLMIIVGDQKAIDIALGNRRQMERYTALDSKLRSRSALAQP